MPAKRYLATVAGVLAALVVSAAVVIGAWLAASLYWGIDDAYALLGAGEMVIDYLKTHDGRWPRSWEDLRPQFSVNNGRVGGWSYGRFQDRIDIDFEVDPDDLRRQSAESPRATFRVIRARWDTGMRVLNDPNQMLCDYFRQEGKRPREGEGKARKDK